MEKGTILVVEDEVFVGEEIKEDLERSGYFVPDVIATGEEVVEAVARYRPDLVLMDVRINGAVDGIEAAYQAKAEFDFPVVYLTAFSDPDTMRRASITKPEAYLLKPFDEAQLISVIENAIAKARKAKEQTEIAFRSPEGEA